MSATSLQGTTLCPVTSDWRHLYDHNSTFLERADSRSKNSQGSVRYPYPAIGELAYGRFGRYLVSLSLNFTQFGATVVYVLLAAENIMKLLPEGSTLNCCLMALIVGCVMTPFTWLGTP